MKRSMFVEAASGRWLGCNGEIFWNNCAECDCSYCAPDYVCVCNEKMETSASSESSAASEDCEEKRLKRGRVLGELLETERLYVQELGFIIKSVEGAQREGGVQRRLHGAQCLLQLTQAGLLVSRALCNMKYGKYELHKSATDISFSTSYSWYYKKNEGKKGVGSKSDLVRTVSDSDSLFSDYTNQIRIFDNDNMLRKRCKKSMSYIKSDSDTTGKMKKSVRNSNQTAILKADRNNENFSYGIPLVEFQYMDAISSSDQFSSISLKSVTETFTSETTTDPTVRELPMYIKNPIYSYSDRFSSATQSLNNSSQTSCPLTLAPPSSTSQDSLTTAYNNSLQPSPTSKKVENIFSSILKDYTRKMQEWNYTVSDYYTHVPNTRRMNTSMSSRSTSDSGKSIHSTLSCGKSDEKSVNSSNCRITYDYATVYLESKTKAKGYDGCSMLRYKSLPCISKKSNMTSKFHTIDRHNTHNYTTSRGAKKRWGFWKDKEKEDVPPICRCLESLCKNYDIRLQEWCDTISETSMALTSAKGYKEEIENPDNKEFVPPALIGKADVLFGNLHELFTFHSDIFLKDLENCISTTELVALCFVQKRDTFFRLYSYYCQNIPRSERLREALVDTHFFLQACQLKLGHKLPLAAYLLKPVQRITKYQLLLKDLLKYSECGTVSKGLQEALDCMLVVLKWVNDSMHQIAITGFPIDLNQQGELLMQDSFSVVTDSKRDITKRLRTRQRHIFLYQKALLFCKPAAKNSHNKATYHYKNYLEMSQIGLTETVKGDGRRFEVWLKGRAEVHTLTATDLPTKQAWVARIKRVLLHQLEELKGERVRQYGHQHRSLSSLSGGSGAGGARHEEQSASSDGTVSDDEVDVDEDDYADQNKPVVGAWLVALADYCAVGQSEVSLQEGDQAELLKVGCAGWWFVRVTGAREGWAPAAYLEQSKSSRASSRSHSHNGRQ